ncbi:MAG: hypothetical protein H6741_07120 [Alphaproteobacteria bacterium]|nr:hypothetical protein [Alphaproteobacteria bacterium]
MLPTLKDGETVLVELGAAPKTGDLVVAKHPHVKDLVLVKRVAERVEAGWRLAGDNPAESTHSFGAVPEVLGVVRSRLPG